MIKPFKRALSSDPMKQVASVVPTRQTWSLFEEFKNFAFKGNVVDLAIGVIIGAAFGKIIDALVKDMALVGFQGRGCNDGVQPDFCHPLPP